MATDETPTGGQPGSDSEGGSPRVADGQPTSPGDQKSVDKAIAERLARAERKHAKDLEEARLKAVQDFRSQHGLTDEIMGQVGSSQFAGVYKRVAELEAENRAYRERETQAAEEKHRAAVSDALFGETRLTQHSVIPDEEARAFVLSQLRDKLSLDGGKLIVKDDAGRDTKRFIDEWLSQRDWLLAPSSQGGAGSRPPRAGSIPHQGEPTGSRDPSKVLLRGDQHTAEERAQALRRFARQ